MNRRPSAHLWGEEHRDMREWPEKVQGKENTRDIEEFSATLDALPTVISDTNCLVEGGSIGSLRCLSTNLTPILSWTLTCPDIDETPKKLGWKRKLRIKRTHYLGEICFLPFKSRQVSNNGSVQSCPTLCNPMDCSPPGFSVHAILQARILEWVAIPYSRISSWPRDWTHVSCISCIGRWILYH